MVRIIDNYTLYEIIGEGNYGKVYRGVNRDDNQEYAVKVIQSKKFKLDKKLEEYTINQINILTNIQPSPHIIRYHGMLKSTNNFYFVYQFCNNGTLAELIEKKKHIKQNQALKIFNQLLQAFKILQKNHVMHRDLKPDNIFFNDQILKLGDFGFCKSLGQNTVTKTMLGSPVYMAPQVLRGQKYTNRADIWSIGVVLYEMLYGYCPFQSTSINKLIQVIDTCEVCFQETIHVSLQTKQLINKLLTKDVKKRISWNELFQIKINQDGEYIKKVEPNPIKQEHSQPRSLSFAKSLNKLKGVKPFAKRPQTSHDHFPQTNFLKERTPSIFNKKMKTQLKQEGSKQKNISLKIPTIQQDTDDESLHNKFIRRKQNKSGYKQHPLFLQKHRKTSEEVRLVYYKHNPVIAEANTSKIAISNQHKDITKGITISKLFATSALRHSRLFTQLLLTQVIERLINLKEKSQQACTAPQIINLINSQLATMQTQLQQMKRNNEQNTNLINQYKSDLISLLKEKVPECKNPKLCYEMSCYLLKLPMQRLSVNEMKEQLQKILA